MDENEIGTVIVDCAIQLHQALGPGLRESVYGVVLARQLEKRGLRVLRQVSVAIEYEGERFEQGFRADLIIEDKVIEELKISGESAPLPQEAASDLSPADRAEARVFAQLRRTSDETWNH